jgi:hypothetical protein
LPTSTIAVGIIAFACLFGGASLGMILRKRLPDRHLNEDSRHLLGLALGVVGTMAGLVLGLLVASATNTYNTQRSELLDAASKVITLDHILAHYGSASTPARQVLREAVQTAVTRMWSHESGAHLPPTALMGPEGVVDQVESLVPKNDEQRSLKSEAVGLTIDLAQTRWLMYEQSDSAVSMPLLVLLIFWFTITFIGFGLFAPTNTTVVVALGLCALAVSGAIFITLEMFSPFRGLVQLSSAPLREALALMGR